MLDKTYLFTTVIKADNEKEAWNGFVESLFLTVEEKPWEDAVACAKNEFKIEEIEESKAHNTRKRRR
jgi:hypothetical protein